MAKLTAQKVDALRWGNAPYPVIFYGHYIRTCEGLRADGLMARTLGNSKKTGIVYATTDAGRVALQEAD